MILKKQWAGENLHGFEQALPVCEAGEHHVGLVGAHDAVVLSAIADGQFVFQVLPQVGIGDGFRLRRRLNFLATST